LRGRGGKRGVSDAVVLRLKVYLTDGSYSILDLRPRESLSWGGGEVCTFHSRVHHIRIGMRLWV
jgi:hypothetical protein